jgi:hypothetical protein
MWAATRHAPGLGTAQVTGWKASADEPYEGILHVRICGGRRGQPRPLPGSEQPPRFAVRESRTSATRPGYREPRALSRRGGCLSVLALAEYAYAARHPGLVTGLFAFAFVSAGIAGLVDFEPRRPTRWPLLHLIADFASGGATTVLSGMARNWSARPTERRLLLLGLAAGIRCVACILALGRLR